jgi:hypothetical protein
MYCGTVVFMCYSCVYLLYWCVLRRSYVRIVYLRRTLVLRIF